MSKKKNKYIPSNINVNDLAKRTADAIGNLAYRSGQSVSQTFQDWIAVSQATLDSIPRHYASALESGTFAEDTPEVKALWDQLVERYLKDGMTVLSQCFGNLMLASELKPYTDHAGGVHELLELGNPRAGQYFTPEEVTTLMGKMIVGDGEALLKSRIKDALAHPDNHIGYATLLASCIVPDDQIETHFYKRVLPAAVPYFEKPIQILDPCVGSGRMLLAAAAEFPQWANKFGFVQFYGVDISPVCVSIARLNISLYGLNGVGVHALDLSDEMIFNLPPPFNQMYTLIKQAKDAGNDDMARAVECDLRQQNLAFDPAEYVQLELFQPQESEEESVLKAG